MNDYKSRRFKNDKETQELQELTRRQEYLRSLRRFQCDHTSSNGMALLERSTDQKALSLASNPENVYYCKDCGSVFELTTFDKEDFGRWAFQFRSAFEQIKSLVNMTEQEFDEVAKAISAIENLATVGWRYYNRCILQELGGGKNNNARKKSSKGSINIGRTFNHR